MHCMSKNRSNESRNYYFRICVRAKKFKIESKGNPLWKSGSQSFFTILLLYRKFYRSYFLIYRFALKNFYIIAKKDGLELFENQFLPRKIKLSRSIISAMLKPNFSIIRARHSLIDIKRNCIGEIIEVTNRLPITFSLRKISNGAWEKSTDISFESRSGVNKMIKNVNCEGGRSV